MQRWRTCIYEHTPHHPPSFLQHIFILRGHFGLSLWTYSSSKPFLSLQLSNLQLEQGTPKILTAWSCKALERTFLQTQTHRQASLEIARAQQQARVAAQALHFHHMLRPRQLIIFVNVPGQMCASNSTASWTEERDEQETFPERTPIPWLEPASCHGSTTSAWRCAGGTGILRRNTQLYTGFEKDLKLIKPIINIIIVHKTNNTRSPILHPF